MASPVDGRAADAPILEVRDLRTTYFGRSADLRVVDGVSFSLRPAETLGLVGESGSGKSVLLLSLLRLLPDPKFRTIGGSIILDGVDVLSLSDREMRRVRGRLVSLIMQDPTTALNPVLTIGDQVHEALAQKSGLSADAKRQRVVSLLRSVGLPNPERQVRAYPHELSGGMRQRVAGAIALACEPKVLLADEPTTALDPTVRLQFLRLLKRLQRELGFGMIFVSHDLGVVSRICDRVGVMYAGRLVELGTTDAVVSAPQHPYTRALVGSIVQQVEGGRLPAIGGQPPDFTRLPEGCYFAPRCPAVMDICKTEYPPVADVAGHQVACWLHADRGPQS